MLTERSSHHDRPEKCHECVKSTRPSVHERCDLCQNLRLQEDVFCYLNRSAQDHSPFECHAFQPGPKLVASSGKGPQIEPGTRPSATSLADTLDSDKFKYQRALALQRLSRDPADVIMDIKYHFAWNVVGRRAVFLEPEAVISAVINTIADCSDPIGGFAWPLWLAPDHIHIRVDSNGEVSPDTMAQELKRLSEPGILEQLPELITSPGSEARLWDEAYFVETIG